MIRPFSLAVRSICIVLAVAALMEPGGRAVDHGIHTVYLLDGSASMEPDVRSGMVGFVATSVETLAPPDTASLISFSASPEILQEPVSSSGDIRQALERWSDTTSRDTFTTGRGYTRYGQALSLAAALLPDTGDRRIVLLSDGLPTDMAAAGEIPPLPEDLRISTVFVSSDTPFPEVRIARLTAPRRAAQGDLYDLAVTVESNFRTSVILEMDQNGVQPVRDRLDLVPGMQTFTYRRTAGTSDPVEVTISPELDRLPENNRSEIRVLLREERSLLYLRPRNETGQMNPPPLAQALSLQGYAVTEGNPSVLTGGGGTLLAYELIILDDIPSTELPLPAQAMLDRYVRQGGGVIVVGGPDSFGSGTYAHTPVEALMPVSFDITSRLQIPSLAILYLVDKSGSMRGTRQGISKLDLVKEAVLSSVEVLQPNQVVALLSFDADTEWTIPFTAASQRELIITDVEKLSPGGGTELAQAMETALVAMGEIETAARHVILLSDGLTREADFDEIAQRFHEEEVTVSAVSIGSEADRELMERIARIGGGRSYHAEGVDEIPQIFARETGIVARNSVVTETFFPVPGDDPTILSGIDPLEFPPLGGFVLTYPKATARIVLEAPGGQPLLAWWQYGTGQAAAFTSDINGFWGSSWAEWSRLPLLAGQLADATVRTTDNPGVSLTVDSTETTFTVSLSLLDETGTPRHPDDPVSLHTVLPNLRETTDVMTPIGPGRLEHTLPMEVPGTYLFTVTEGTNYLTSFSHTNPYSGEFSMRSPNPAILKEIARKGGGISVSIEEGSFPAERLPLLSRPVPARRALWPLLLTAAVVLFVVETLISAFFLRRTRE